MRRSLFLAGMLLASALGTQASPPLPSGLVGYWQRFGGAIGAGIATQSLGFSMELGAFLAGFLLSGTIFRHKLAAQIAPLRDLFLAVFFTTLGMRLNPHVMIESWWIILIGGILMSFIKAIAISFTCWSLGATAVSAQDGPPTIIWLSMLRGAPNRRPYVTLMTSFSVLFRTMHRPNPAGGSGSPGTGRVSAA